MDKKAETKMALKIRKATGKKLRTCCFCVRYQRGNYRRAMEMCSNDSSEVDWCS